VICNLKLNCFKKPKPYLMCGVFPRKVVQVCSVGMGYQMDLEGRGRMDRDLAQITDGPEWSAAASSPNGVRPSRAQQATHYMPCETTGRCTPTAVAVAEDGHTPERALAAKRGGKGEPAGKRAPQAAQPHSGDGAAPLRVALLDGDAAHHDMVRSQLATHAPDWQLDSHTHGATAWQLLRATPPQLILLERTLPDGCGLEWLRRCTRQMPAVPVVMLTTQNCAQTLWAAMVAGAQGYWVKGGDTTDLVKQLREALDGKPAFCDQAQRLLLPAFALMRPRGGNQWGLSRREEEVMQCLCENKTEKDIGVELRIETGTVHTHLMKIYKKLAVHDRASAIRIYLAAMWGG